MSEKNTALVGSRLPIRDAALKATGELKYVADMKLPRMLHAKMLYSPVPHAKITSIDTSEAEALPGVRAVVCHLDDPGVYFNSCGEDIDIFKTERIFDDTVRFVGDKVAAVAADTVAIAEKAVRLIKVEYEELPAVFDPEEALKEGAPEVQPGGNLMEEVPQSIGDVDAAMAAADYVFEDRYYTQPIHHAAIETHTAIAQYDGMGKLTVYSPSQDTFGVRINLTRIFGLPMSRVRVVAPAIGGAFGGKIDAVLEPVVSLLAIKTGRPVKLELNRKEDIASSRTRHSVVTYLKTGVMKDGTITAQDFRVIANAGAYATGSSSIVWAMCSKVFRFIRAKNIRFLGLPVYTNMQPAGAMRGFGNPQQFFAQQRQMARIAQELGIDMLEMERKNLVRTGDGDLRTGDSLSHVDPIGCAEKGAELFGWEAAQQETAQSRAENGRYRVGSGFAVAVHGNGVYGVRPDTSGIMLKMNEDGSVTLYTGNHDMGNGVVTTQSMLAGQVLGLPLARIAVVQADTESTIAHFGDFSSRGTFVCGQAAQKCAEIMAEKIKQYAAEMWETDAEGLSLADGQVHAPGGKSAPLAELVAWVYKTHQTDIVAATTFAATGLASSYGAHFAKVRVDTETGAVQVLDYVAVHDVGRPLNPMNLEGQIEGAIQMGLGHAFSEDAGVDEKGAVKNPNFRKYKLFQSVQMPERIRIAFADNDEPHGPFGAKSIGECAVVPCIGALGNAVSAAIGGDIHDLPMTPEAVLAALKA